MSPQQRWVGAWMSGLPVLFIGIAGLLKLADLSAFHAAVREWVTIDERVAALAALAVPAAEVAIPAIWLAGWHRTSAWLSFGLLSAFSAALAWKLATGRPPHCGCLGILDRWYRDASDARIALGRNLVLLLSAAGGLWLTRTKHAPSHARSTQPEPAGTRAPAFTLTEILVSMVIIAILTVLAAGGLFAAREKARATAVLSTLRSHAQIFGAYVHDWRDAFPMFIPPDGRATFVLPSGVEHTTDMYFNQHFLWSLALAPAYYSDDPLHPSFFGPRSLGPSIGADYFYACAFVAAPDYWRAETRIGPSQWGATLSSGVLSPDAKVLLTGRLAAWPDRPAPSPGPFAFVDGGAADPPSAAVQTGYPNGDGDVLHSLHGQSDWPRGLHTIGGIRGRDLSARP